MLRSAQEEYQARIGKDIFDINFVYVRDKDDYVVARMLSRAIELIFKGEIERADEEVERAKDLSPNYFEVYRVKAYTLVNQDDFFGANSAYEAAISFAPNRAPLRLWYGGFLSRSLGDSDGALVQLLKAEELAPDSVIVKLECARVLQYKKRFDEAQDRLSSVKEIEKASSRTRRVHLDLQIQNSLRKADYKCGEEAWEDALELLEAAQAQLEGAPAGIVDERTMRSFQRARKNLPALRRAFKGLPQAARVTAFESFLRGEANFSEPPRKSIDLSKETQPDVDWNVSAYQPALPTRGRLSHLHERYGFVTSGNQRFFFPRSSWRGAVPYSLSLEGKVVDFEHGQHEKGPGAINVRLVDETGHSELLGKTLTGKVKFLQTTFGFITIDSGSEIFFHRSSCIDQAGFRALQVGQRVRFMYAMHEDRRVFADAVSSYSGDVKDFSS